MSWAVIHTLGAEERIVEQHIVPEHDDEMAHGLHGMICDCAPTAAFPDDVDVEKATSIIVTHNDEADRIAVGGGL